MFGGAEYNLQSSGVGGPVGYGGPSFGFGGGFGGGCGSGFGPFGLFGLIGLLGGRGLFGGDDCGRGHGGHSRGGDDECRRSIWESVVMSKLGTIEAAVPAATAAINANTTAVGTGLKDNIQELAMGISNGFQTQLLTTLQGVNNVKDTVQLGIAAGAAQAAQIEGLINSTTCAIKGVVMSEAAATRDVIQNNRIQDLQTQLLELRADHRNRGSEFNITQSTNVAIAQSQQQQQQQFQWQRQDDFLKDLSCRLGSIEAIQNQLAKQQMGSAVNFGSGSQTYTPSQANNQVGGQI